MIDYPLPLPLFRPIHCFSLCQTKQTDPCNLQLAIQISFQNEVRITKEISKNKRVIKKQKTAC